MAAPRRTVSPELSGFELGSMAAILDQMARRGTAAPTAEGSAVKIRALRNAIPRGLGKGTMEVVPREVLQEDLVVAKKLVSYLKSYSPKERKKESQIREIIRTGPARIDFDDKTLSWPWPADATKTRCRFDMAMPPAKCAHFLVAKRYGLSQETVRRAMTKKARGARAHTPYDREFQSLLAWAFTDLCASNELGASEKRCRDHLFEALMSLGYEPFVLYYRVLLSQSLGKVRAYPPDKLLASGDLDQLITIAKMKSV